MFLGLCGFLCTFSKFVNGSGRIYQILFSRKERVAARTDFRMDCGFGRAN
jgi:hypothetical protein